MRPRRWVLLWVGGVVLAGCTNSPEVVAPTAANVTSTSVAASPGGQPSTASESPTAASEFRMVADDITRSLLLLQPELVTDLGASDAIGASVDYLLNDLSAQGAAALQTAATDGLLRLQALDTATLTDDERVSAAILDWYLQDVVTMAGYRDYENPVNFITGEHAAFAEFMADVHPVLTEQDAEDYVDRLIAFGTQVDQIVNWLGTSAARGIVPADGSLQIARYQIEATIGTGDPYENPLVTDLKERIEAMPDEDPDWAVGVVARAAATVDGIVIPALDDLDDAIRAVDGLPAEQPGVLNLPGGDEYYAAVLRHHLSLDMTPEEVHELGLEQVDRVVAEMTVALDALGYPADDNFAQAVLQAAAAAGSLPTTSEPERAAVLEQAAATVDNAAGVFESMFSVLPQDQLHVVRPRPGREGGSGAYYRPPPIDGSRPGVFYLSLGGSEFGLLTLDTTIYHEAIPGHHFQLSLQRSSGDLPLHQRAFDFTGFAEGWGLYAERLAYEAGLYDDDPLGNIGRLRLELLRAARMVADTGIHWAGWSRDEAIDYLGSLGFDRAQASSEVDRYIVWPGQAPSYMVGMLEILRLRDKAQAELGAAFDLVAFHDAILSHGSVPLALLELVVDDWVAATRAAS